MNVIPCSGVLPISRVLYTQDNVILTSVVGDKKKTAIMIMRVDSKRERQSERETVRERERVGEIK